MNTRRECQLGDGQVIWLDELPADLVPTDAAFADWWRLHPEDPPTIRVRGYKGPAPRFQQAYGHDYRFSGQTSIAVPLPDQFSAVTEWVKATVHAGINGAVATWYDATQGHYLGAHRDETKDLVPGTPIVTISFGDPRVFRLQRHRLGLRHDIVPTAGQVILLPWAVNRTWTHEIVKTTRPGHRISLTYRCFD